jgi:hypothetical protein
MKKRSLSILLFVLFCITARSQNVAINNTGQLPNAQAILDVNATSKGILIPRVKLVDNDNPVNGAKPIGLMIWNDSATVDNKIGFYFWNGTRWQGLTYYAGDAINIDNTNTIKVLPNQLNQNGYVPAPTSANKNAYYKTDKDGNPRWQPENLTMYYIDEL